MRIHDSTVAIVRLFVLLIVTCGLGFLSVGTDGSPATAECPGGGLPEDREFDTDARIDINEIEMFLTNLGGFGRNESGPGGPAGTYFPRGTTKTCLYTAGLWLGGMAHDGLRVTVAEYSYEYEPGRILESGGWTDPNLPQYRIYKLTPNSGPGDSDYDEWPVDDGAPVDSDGLPFRAGDQTLWSVFHDANPQSHTNDAGNSLPIGVEVTHLTYAYDMVEPFDRVILVDYRLWHRGSDPLEDAVIGIWLDIDLGDSSDDLSGCDSLLGLTYCRNAGADEVYGDRAPAVGIVALRGPGNGPNPIHAAIDYVNGEDPDYRFISYNLLQGLSQNGETVFDPTTGRPTRYWHAGDPVADEGWIDRSPADKRNLVGLGPIDFVPGQVESLRVAFAIGLDTFETPSTKDLKDIARCLRRLDSKGAFPARSRWAIAGFYPNPFDPTVDPVGRAFIVAPEAGRAQVTIHDEHRLPIRSLGFFDVAGGLHPVDWDGRDDDGNLVPAGEYRLLMNVVRTSDPTVFPIRDTEPMVVEYSQRGSRGLARGNVVSEHHRSIVLQNAGWIDVGLNPDARVTHLRLLDVNGRCRRSVELPAGEKRLWWDGRDEAGVFAPAGIYFVSADGNRSRCARVVLLR